MSSLIRRTCTVAALLLAILIPSWPAHAVTTPIEFTQGSCSGFFAERNVSIKNVDTAGAFVTVANTPEDFSGTFWLPAGQTYSFQATGGSTVHVYKFNPTNPQTSNWATTGGCPGTPRSLAGGATKASAQAARSIVAVKQDEVLKKGVSTQTVTGSSLSWVQGSCVYGPNGQTPLSTMTITNNEANRVFFATSEGSPTYGANYVLNINEGFQLAPVGSGHDSITIFVYSGSTMHIALLNSTRQQYDIPVTSGQTCIPPDNNNGTMISPTSSLPVAPAATLAYREGSCGSGSTAGYRTVYVKNNDTSVAYVTYNFQALMGGLTMDTDYIRVGQENSYLVLADGTTALHMRRYNANTTILDHSVTSCP